jgi:alkylation response protein AidB-like acyl-CoA dehydrogenase
VPQHTTSTVGGMEPKHTAEAEAYREKIQAFLGENLPQKWNGLGALNGEQRSRFTAEWRQILSDNKLLATTWSTEYGGPGLSALENVIIAEEFAKAGVPTAGSNDGFGISMVGNTIIQWGTEEQKKHFLPRILSGEDLWCQGYSEPNAGSDLANLGTKAELDGDEWILNGQKIWTSQGHSANWIFVLGRTDADAAKHAGISFFLCPMDQPGVEVRPIRNIAGHSHFNEVFFDNARLPKDNVVGGVNNGWAVAMTLLGYERGAGASVNHLRHEEELGRLMGLAKERGKTTDPEIRQRLAWCHSKVEIMRFMGMQALTSFLSGNAPGAGSSTSKLNWSEYHKVVTELSLDILGADAMIMQGDPDDGSGLGTAAPGTPNTNNAWINAAFAARSGTIYAGTSEVQRNIIGERILGLPKEPRSDKGPWKDTPK